MRAIQADVLATSWGGEVQYSGHPENDPSQTTFWGSWRSWSIDGPSIRVEMKAGGPSATLDWCQLSFTDWTKSHTKGLGALLALLTLARLPLRCCATSPYGTDLMDRCTEKKARRLEALIP